jgi:hypothetical protein
VHTRAYIMTFTWLGALRPLSGPISWVLGRYLNAGIFTPVHDIYYITSMWGALVW